MGQVERSSTLLAPKGHFQWAKLSGLAHCSQERDIPKLDHSTWPIRNGQSRVSDTLEKSGLAHCAHTRGIPMGQVEWSSTLLMPKGHPQWAKLAK